MKSILGLSLLPLLASASPAFKVGTIHNDVAPVLSSANAIEVPDSYMIVFKDHVDHNAAKKHHSWVQQLHLKGESSRADLRKRSPSFFSDNVFKGLRHTYNIPGGLRGYSGHFDEELIEQIRRHPDVELIERDSIVHTMANDSSETEKNAPWGLARISHRDSLSFGTFNKYLYATDGGEGVDVYVIDTGTNIQHVDFEGRASWGATIPSGDADEDGNGHGTHCSGTVAGKKYGVAKKAHIKAVKVLRSNGSGSMSDVVKGVEYAAEEHTKQVEAASKGKKKGFKGSAANMSLGGGPSPTLDRAVNAAVAAGIHFAVAAGNDNADSCNYSPAAAQNAVTVGASNFADERAYFSNYGTCNDIFAPGLDIKSTWIGSKYATNTISGTSMASPHIAGLLAYFLSLQPAKDSAYAVAEISPKKLKAHIIAIGTKGALSSVPSNTANVLAWNGGGSSNFSDIVSKGGYTVRAQSSRVNLDIEEIEDEVVSISHKVSDEVSDTLEELKEIEAAMSAELENLKNKISDLLA